MTYERFVGTGEFGEPAENEDTLLFKEPPEAFEDMNAQAWIDTFRIEDSAGRFDVEATVAAAGIALRMDGLDRNGKQVLSQGFLSIVEGKPHTMTINMPMDDGEIGITAGHELGHAFLITAAGLKGYHGRAEEAFCDYFGLQTALPAQKLREIKTVDTDTVATLKTMAQIKPTTVMRELARVGLVPPQILVRSTLSARYSPEYAGLLRESVMCVDCEDHHDHNKTVDVASLPFYDFTSQPWGDYFWTSRHTTNDMADLITLNLQHGLWTLAHDREFTTSSTKNPEAYFKTLSKLSRIAFEQGDQLVLF
ncbi:hypothetical protein BH09PAT3_BH09PAT3_3850 [soil metagenome]